MLSDLKHGSEEQRWLRCPETGLASLDFKQLGLRGKELSVIPRTGRRDSGVPSHMAHGERCSKLLRSENIPPTGGMCC